MIFRLSLIQLPKELNLTVYSKNIQKISLNHLFVKDDNDLEGLLQTVKKFRDGIGISFGLNKCAKATFKRGKLTGATSVELDRNTLIQDLKQEEV